MHRIDTPSAQVDKFGAGKNGFTGGNPQTGELPTALSADFFDSLQEELCAIIEGAGINLDKTKRNQLATALPLFLGLGEAAKRGVGTGKNQIPDMSAFKYSTSGSAGIVIELPGGIIIQMDEGTTDSNGYYAVNMGVALSSYLSFAVESHVSGWTASGGKYLLSTKYGTEKVSASKFIVRSSTWRDSDKSEIAQPTVFNWIAIGRL